MAHRDDGAASPSSAASSEDAFERQLDALRGCNEDDLRRGWRVWTRAKNVMEGRRLENASWRLWNKERIVARGDAAAPPALGADLHAGALPAVPAVGSSRARGLLARLDRSMEKSLDLTRAVASLVYGQEDAATADSPSSDSGSDDHAATEEEDRDLEKPPRRHGAEASLFGGRGDGHEAEDDSVEDKLCNKLWDIKQRHDAAGDLSSTALQEILDAMRACPDAALSDMPADVAALEARVQRGRATAGLRPPAAAFSHSLERNGANNFLLYSLRRLAGAAQSFELFSPTDGPMRADFEELGVRVHIHNPREAGYMEAMRAELRRFGVVLCNTIMRAEVVRAAQQADLPFAWVIHEAWPREEFDTYAAKVFQMEHISPSIIREAFAGATPDRGVVVFPARVQMALYEGLVPAAACRVVYNGIPVTSLNAFRASTSRTEVRAKLGYGKEDFVVLHLGTVCARKAQHVTATAFSRLVREDGCTNAKLLMVGARYIRDHEIAYIDRVKGIIEAGGPEVSSRFRLLDIHKDVLQFYLAADVVLVPSMNEVLPLVICEAMAFERPVIASRIDGIPEALDHDVEGLLVPAGDAGVLADSVLNLYRDPAKRSRMGAAGRRRVMRQFSYDAMAKTYRGMLDGVVASRAATAPAAAGATKAAAAAGGAGAGAGDEAFESKGKETEAPTSPLASSASEASTPTSSAGSDAATAGKKSSAASIATAWASDRSPRASQPASPPRIPSHRRLALRSGDTVLVDMDSVIVDWDGAFLDRWLPAHPGDERRVRERRHYEIEANFEPEAREAVVATICKPGMYAAMKALPGAIEGLRAMRAAGLDVRIVSAPHHMCAASSAAEKFEWVSEHLGDDWIERLVLTRDKTHVRGDALIDDKPAVTGSATPTWQHVVFTQPWNAGVSDTRPRMDSWAEWQTTLLARITG